MTLRVRATKPGRWVARGVRVDYRDGDRLLSAYFPRALILCAPADASVACDPISLATISSASTDRTRRETPYRRGV